LNRKVFILGLDGASPDVIDSLIEKGRLPSFRALKDRGVSGRLRTTIPPITGSAWSSFMTGKNPGKHGIFDFTFRKEGKYELSPINARMREGKTFWSIATEADKKVCIFNVPVTYPPDAVNGIMVSGMLTPSSRNDYTHPLSVARELDRVTGKYQIHITESYSKKREEHFLRHLYEVTTKQKKAMDFLLSEDEWDLFVAVFQGIDVLQHELWHTYDRQHFRHGQYEERYIDTIPQFYAYMDKVLGEVMEWCDRKGATLIVMSDHGAGPLKKLLYVNNFLIKKGFLKLKGGAATRFKHLLFRLGMAPMTFYHILLTVGLGRLKHKTRFGQGSSWLKKFFLSFEDVDWSASRAYAIGSTAGQIYVNLEGREPGGIVKKGKEYEAAREEIITELKELSDPETGQHIIEEIYRKEELYSGPHAATAPDIVFLPKGLEIVAFGEYEFASHRILDYSRGLSSSHRMDGIIMMQGEGLKEGSTLFNGNIMDIAPTVLYLLGLSIAPDMDGTVLREAIDQVVLEQNPIQMGDSDAINVASSQVYTKDEEEELKAHLKSLGYFE
jgi:predicted AlkP superfamily phosphohydrolase/phosphomutase